MSEMDQYARYFTTGMKVGVGIPLPNAEVFRDWAVIHDLDEDLVSLQLSRDQLPVRVTLHVGQILEIRGGGEETGYSVRAIIVSEGYSKELLLRLIGEIVSDELREFYRIDAFLPIKYYLSHEQDSEVLEQQWRLRRQERLENEQLRKQRRWESMYMGDDAEFPNERHMDETDENESDDSWDTIIPLAANISGGGIRIMTHQGFDISEFVLLEILVPSPRRIVDAVGRVTFANLNLAAGTDRNYFNTGLQFVFIDERDRDVVINYISSVQLKRIRQLREKYLFRSVDDEDVQTQVYSVNWQEQLKRVLIWLIMAGIVWMLVSYFRNYAENRPKNEIEEVFENGIRRYIEMHK
jgi:hypothetical protein